MLLLHGGALLESRTVKKSKDLCVAACRLAFIPNIYPTSITDLCLLADQNLFCKVLHNPEHLLPPVSTSSHSYSLRPRAHNRELPDHLSHLADCKFIAHMLFYQSY